MLVTLLAAVVLGQEQQVAGLDVPVTLEAKNSTVSAVMAELEAQTKVKIHVQGGPLQDFVYVRFTNRPLKSALDVMANLCEAKWAASAGEIYFSSPWPPGGDEDYAERLKSISEWLDKNPIPPSVNKASASQIIEDSIQLQKLAADQAETYQKSNKLYRQTPTPRAHMRLIHALGAKELASIPKGESRVYMASAQGRVKALPAAASGIFRDLRSERDLYRQQLTQRGFGSNEEYDGTWIPALQNYGNAYEEFAWVLVVFNEDFGLSSELRGFVEFQEGFKGISTHDVVTINPFGPEFGAVPPDDPFAKFTEPYTVPEELKGAIQLSGPNGNGAPVISESIRTRLANMDRDEILTDFVHHPLGALSETQKKDVVAMLPDIGFFGVVYGSMQPISNLGAALRNAMMGQGRLQEVDGAFVITPQSVLLARKGRIARPQTAAYIRTGLETGMPDLDTSANLAVSMEDDTALMFAMAISALVLGNEPNQFMGSMDVLRLYGHLTPAQRNMAKNEGLTTTFANLTKKQQAIIDKLMNGRNVGLASKDQERDIETTTAGGWDYDDMVQLKLPNGIPPNARVSFSSAKKNKLFGQMEMEGGYKYVGDTTMEQAAWAAAYKEAGYPDYYGSNPSGFTFADRTYLQVVVDLGDLGYFAQSLPIGGPGKDAKFVPINQLPQEMQDEYNQKLKDAREQIKQMGPPPAQGGAGRRPPPP